MREMKSDETLISQHIDESANQEAVDRMWEKAGMICLVYLAVLTSLRGF